jgi:type I restriction enzyme, S subunit
VNYEPQDAVPNGWTSKTLEEFVEEGRAIGYGVLKPGPNVEGGIRLIKSNQVRDGHVDLSEDYRISPELDQEFRRTRLRGGELLLNVVGSIGRSAIAPPELKGANVSRAIAVLPVDTQRAPWIQLFLSSPKCQAEMFGRKVGIAQPVLNLGQVRKLLIPVPPLPEQRRIVAEIEKLFTRLDAGVAALRRLQANLKRYRAAVLKAACEGRLVATEAELARKDGRTYENGQELLQRILAERRKQWAESHQQNGSRNYREPVSPYREDLHQCPGGWTWATFDQVSSLITKGSSPKWQGFDYCDKGILFVRSENVRWGKLDLSDVAHLPATFNEKERKSILHEGDVLLNLVGASIGRAAVATHEVAGGNVNQAVAVIRLVLKEFISEFAVFWLTSAGAQKRIHSEKVDVARANFSLEDARVLPIPLPPLTEQTRIVAEVERRLSVVEELETLVSADLQRAARLRESILKKAFTGELA